MPSSAGMDWVRNLDSLSYSAGEAGLTSSWTACFERQKADQPQNWSNSAILLLQGSTGGLWAMITLTRITAAGGSTRCRIAIRCKPGIAGRWFAARTGSACFTYLQYRFLLAASSCCYYCWRSEAGLHLAQSLAPWSIQGAPGANSKVGAFIRIRTAGATEGRGRN